ncbi:MULTISPECIES: magnesium transporter CorA family protein [Rhodomicrobium]|uniref:magnesium transporter CorA family protein n=1 Tax=Rhodomicrobium TaxID=1068 RepID=UPI000B4BFA24|nr:MULTISPECIES: magnesium transporter CorA family protein [Rhodomicrobium]
MITLYAVENSGLQKLASTVELKDRFGKATWIDLQDPTAEEEVTVEQTLGLNIPTREEMRQIEESSRIYEEHGGLFMTGIVIAGISERRPVRAEVMFVVTPQHLVTIRYSDPLPFQTFQQKCARKPEDHATSDLLFVSLVEQIVQRVADVLEKVTADLDGVAHELFGDLNDSQGGAKALQPHIDLQRVVRKLGHFSALLAKLGESLLSFSRVLAFFQQSTEEWLQKSAKAKAKSLTRDITSLSEYSARLASQIGHLQDATFNLLNIEQSRIIKVFSIAAVVFLPPTLVATIYGMNFKYMPELNWALGYPFALILMVISAIVPIYWFKRSGWL